MKLTYVKVLHFNHNPLFMNKNILNITPVLVKEVNMTNKQFLSCFPHYLITMVLVVGSVNIEFEPIT